MYKNIKLVVIDKDYCDYLRKYDNRVPYNHEFKELRPFIGILFKIENVEYFAPLSSPKEKHKYMKDTIDFIKINDGEYGVINFNNMIPVMENNYIIININNSCIYNNKRIKLLTKQLRWLKNNKDKILFNSYLLYSSYKKGKISDSLKNRCCNFMLLEKKCLEYNKQGNIYELL